MSKALNVEEIDPRDNKDEVSPMEELSQVPLDSKFSDRYISVGSLLEPELRENLVQFLRKNQDIFAWSHEDMPRIDPQVMSHPLSIDPSFCPIKQK